MRKEKEDFWLSFSGQIKLGKTEIHMNENEKDMNLKITPTSLDVGYNEQI